MATRRCPGVDIFGIGAAFWAGLAGVGGEVPVGGEDVMFAVLERNHSTTPQGLTPWSVSRAQQLPWEHARLLQR